jgi:hypothetical protein
VPSKRARVTWMSPWQRSKIGKRVWRRDYANHSEAMTGKVSRLAKMLAISAAFSVHCRKWSAVCSRDEVVQGELRRGGNDRRCHGRGLSWVPTYCSMTNHLR